MHCLHTRRGGGRGREGEERGREGGYTLTLPLQVVNDLIDNLKRNII